MEYPKTIKRSNIKIFCPYQESKLKYIHEDEISHLPMRLAISKTNNNKQLSGDKNIISLKVA